VRVRQASGLKADFGMQKRMKEAMQFKQGHGINYGYDASGTKRVVDAYTAVEGVTVPPGTTETVSVLYHSGQDYCGNAVYFGSGTGVSRLFTPEGYINRQYGVTGNWIYYYTLKDHLGSVRYEFKGDGTNVGYTHYYPSGIEFTDPGTNSQTLQSKERYNDKELQTDFGLNWYDVVARTFDPAVGRLWQPDPLAEKYPWISPYAWCANNPLKYVDLRGDSLTLAGNTTNIQSTVNTYNTGLGGYYTTSADPDGKMSISPVAGTDPNNMTAEQKAYYSSLDKVISGTDGMTTINVVNGTSVVIGDVNLRTIDIGDIQALGNGTDVNQSSALLHETFEQYGVQVKGQTSMAAHLNASGVERLVTGSYVDPINRPLAGGQLSVPVLNPITGNTIKTVIIYVNRAGNVTGIKR